MPKTLTALALLALLYAPSGPVSGTDARVRTGSIEGTVDVRLRPPRRSARRYPGGAAAPRQDQAVPVIAYLVGEVPGSPVPENHGTMLQRDTAFVPTALAVTVGSTVDFPNGDPFFHNVISYSEAKRFDLGRYPEGESKTETFDTPGVVRIYCEVHEFMRSVVIVTENPFHAIVGEDMRFRIDGVPPGEYTLAVFHVDAGTVEQQVTVTDGGTTRIEVELRG